MILILLKRIYRHCSKKSAYVFQFILTLSNNYQPIRAIHQAKTFASIKTNTHTDSSPITDINKKILEKSTSFKDLYNKSLLLPNPTVY